MRLRRSAVAATLAAAGAAGIAQAESPRQFRDWVVGCDNLRTCTAVGLIAENGERWGYLRVTRSGAADAAPELVIAAASETLGATRITPTIVDPQTPHELAPLPAEGDGTYARATLGGAEALALLEALGPAASLDVATDEAGQPAAISLAGMRAALLFADARQLRDGTPTALVGKGDRPASAVPAVPEPPRLAALPMHELPDPLPAPPAGVPAAAGEDCMSGIGNLAIRLDDAHTLWGVCQASGAYNISYRFYLAAGGRAAHHPFPLPAGEDAGRDDGDLVNPALSEDGRILSAFEEGRGIGDCGQTTEWVWDGSRFHLLSHREMPECRGVPMTDWPATFTAATD